MLLFHFLHTLALLSRRNLAIETQEMWLPKTQGSTGEVSKRSTVPQPRLLTYITKHQQGQTTNIFNITVLLGGCENGINASTIAGIYTFANGTTREHVTVGEIAADLRDTERSLSSHTISNARIVSTQSNNLLAHHLICKDPPRGSAADIDRNELRRLLWLSPNAKMVIREYTTIIVSSIIAGGLGGLVGGLGAAYNLIIGPYSDLDPDGSLCPAYQETAKTTYNKLRELNLDLTERLNLPNDWREALEPVIGHRNQTDEEYLRSRGVDEATIALFEYYLDFYSIANEDVLTTCGSNMKQQYEYAIALRQAHNNGIIAGITTFCATLSASIITDLSARRRMRQTEALPPHIYMALMRRLLQEFEARGGNTAATSAAATSDIAAATSSSTTSSSSSSPSASPPPLIDVCTTPEEAEIVMRELSNVQGSEIEMSPGWRESLGMTGSTFPDTEVGIRNQLIGASAQCRV
ncbi:MAG: hypothetical protein Q9218_005747 [Villophora microphyllina]